MLKFLLVEKNQQVRGVSSFFQPPYKLRTEVREESLIWALECLRALQIDIMPALEKIGDNDLLKGLKKDMPRTLIRAGVRANEEMPPKGSEEFKNLLDALKINLSTEGGYQFSLKESALILMTKANPKLFKEPLQLTEEKEQNKSSNEGSEIEEQQISVTSENQRNGVIEDDYEETDELLKTQEDSNSNFQIKHRGKMGKTNSDVLCINSSAYLKIMGCLANFETYLNTHYTSEKEKEKNKKFLEKARDICRKYPQANQEEFKSQVCLEILKEAQSHYHHRHAILRALADLVFIPLGIVTGGALFFAKAAMTNSFTFFIDKKTNRQEKLEEFLHANSNIP